MLNLAFAGDLRKLSRCVTPHRVHLKQAILRGDVALCEEEIVEICGFNGGDAVLVTSYRNCGCGTRHSQASVQLWHGSAGDGIRPDAKAEHRSHNHRERKGQKPWQSRTGAGINRSSGRHGGIPILEACWKSLKSGQSKQR